MCQNGMVKHWEELGKLNSPYNSSSVGDLASDNSGNIYASVWAVTELSNMHYNLFRVYFVMR